MFQVFAQLASYTRARVERIIVAVIILHARFSLLTHAHELKEPLRNLLIFNVLDPHFREPVNFILYRLVLKYRFALNSYRVRFAPERKFGTGIRDAPTR